MDNKEKLGKGYFIGNIDIRALKIAAVSTAVFMLAAYMYAYTNSLTLFDAARLYRGEEPISFSGDKWAINLLGLLDAHVNEPWLAGLWAIFFMSMSVYLIIDILEIQSTWGICLVAGLCATQSSIVCQQGYIGGQYTGEAALVFACFAAWIFLKTTLKTIWKVIFTAICIAISVGIYGAYISMVPSLMILSLIMDIIYKGKGAKYTWKKAILAVGYFLVGIVLYYVILRMGMYFTGAELSGYMEEDSLSSVQQVVDKPNYILGAYKYIIKYYLGRLSAHYWYHYLPGSLEKIAFYCLVVGICLSILTLFRYRKKIADLRYNIILLLGLLLVLPLSLNLIYVFASGNVHHLMIFTYVLPYVFFVKLMEMESCAEVRYKAGYLLSVIYKIIVCVFVYYSVVMANATFVRLNHLYVTAQSVGTRFLGRIESCEGFDGTETIHLVGEMTVLYNEYFSDPISEAEILDAYLGNAMPDLGTGFNELFLINIMDSKLNYDYDRYRSVEQFIQKLKEMGEDEEVIKQIKAMPAFPSDGSVKKIGGDIYVIFTTDEMGKEYIEKYGL